MANKTSKPKKYVMEIMVKRVPLEKDYDVAYSMSKITSEMSDCSSDELIKDILMETFEKTRDYGDAIVSGDEING